jgi:fatty acid desaturase
MTRRYRVPNALNIVVILLQCGAVAACIWMLPSRQTVGGVLLVTTAFAIVMNSVYATIHEAEHRMLFDDQRLNDAAGVFLALLFPAPFHLLRQGHLGHHLRNRSDDEAFDLYFDGEHPAWKRLQLYGILTGFYWLVAVLANFVVLVVPFVMRREHFGFDRPSSAFMDALNPRYKNHIRAEAIAVVVLHAAVIRIAGIPFWKYAVMYAGFGFSWSAMQYVHHFGTTRHVLEGARNLWLWGPVDLVWLNHNWHLTHHKHPTVPWIHLPNVGREENPDRGFLPIHYLRMWSGPRKATEHVENRYAGRLIR